MSITVISYVCISNEKFKYIYIGMTSHVISINKDNMQAIYIRVDILEGPLVLPEPYKNAMNMQMA